MVIRAEQIISLNRAEEEFLQIGAQVKNGTFHLNHVLPVLLLIEVKLNPFKHFTEQQREQEEYQKALKSLAKQKKKEAQLLPLVNTRTRELQELQTNLEQLMRSMYSINQALYLLYNSTFKANLVES
jgi:hypothetical protein